MIIKISDEKFESEWLINHDIDLLLSKEFCKYIKEVCDDDVNWVQPYYGGRVIYLTEEQTQQVEERYLNNDIVSLDLKNNHPKKSYAPGGSLMVESFVIMVQPPTHQTKIVTCFMHTIHPQSRQKKTT